jgi:hypothetical protein
MHQTSFMVCKAFDLLKERTKAFSFDVERLKKLERGRNVELGSNSYTIKVPLIKRPLVSFFKLLEVHIHLFSLDNIQKKNVQPVMSNNNVKLINLLTPQLMAYDSNIIRLAISPLEMVNPLMLTTKQL